MIIRGIEEADFPRVGEVDAAARWHAYKGVLPDDVMEATTAQAQSESWQERVAKEAASHRLLVAERNGQVVGYSYVGPGDDPEIGDLYALFVHPEAHGTGVAQQLHVVSLAELEGMGYRRFLLWVHVANRQAIRFYEKAGWFHDGTRATNKFGQDNLRYLKDAD